MNDQIYLTIADLDSSIFAFCDNLRLIKISQLNKHYCTVLKSLRNQMTDIYACCAAGHLDVIRTVVCRKSKGKRIYDDDQCVKVFNHAFQYGQIPIAKWFMGFFDHLKIHTYEISSCAFVTACKYGQKSIALWILNFYMMTDGVRINIHYSHELPFRSACENGMRITAQMLMDLESLGFGRINIDQTDSCGKTAFHLACINGHFEIANWLIEQKKNNSTSCIRGWTRPVLIDACEKGNLSLIIWLFDLDANLLMKNNIYELIKVSTMHGHLDIIKELFAIAQRYDYQINLHKDEDTLFRTACSNGHIHIVQWLLEVGNGSYGLDYLCVGPKGTIFSACRNGHIDMVQYLINLCPDFNFEPNTYDMFRLACIGGHKLMAKWIWSQYRCDLHATEELIFRFTCQNGQLDVAQWLLKISEESRSKINIHTLNNWVFRHSDCTIRQWLIELEQYGYGPIPKNLIKN